MKFLAAFLIPLSLLMAQSQGRDVRQTMENAEQFGKEAAKRVLRDEFRPYWAKDGSRLIYRIDTGRDAYRFFEVNLKSGAKFDAFDHEALAKSLSKAASPDVRADSLPIENLVPSAESGIIRLRAFGKGWRYDASTAEVSADTVPPKSANLVAPEDLMRRVRRSSAPTSITVENGTADEIELLWAEGRGQLKSYGTIPPGQSATRSTYGGHAWIVTNAAGEPLAGMVADDSPSFARVTGKIEPAPRKRDDISPDGQWRALIRDHNLAIEPTAGGDTISLTSDGTAHDSYTGPFHWSPDSRKLVAWCARHVETRKIHIVESSPPDQLQPKLQTIDYPKPGDAIHQPKPRLFDIASRRAIAIDESLFDNPWEISELAWSSDSSEFSFVYNQRGHQVMRVLAIQAGSGSVRTVVEETNKTFIDYSQKFYLHRLPETRELLWTSERDGRNRLYRIDETSGRIKNRLPDGEWIVREVVKVDEATRQLLLKLVGAPGQDPYHVHFARVNFDGSGFTRLTQSDGNHGIEFSPDGQWFIDHWSRVDQPPVVELRRAADGSLVAELERADDAALRETGWSRPERFVAKGRDGKTDIYGIIVRPTRFDPSKNYPVVEDIYAGPQDHFVPKNYSAWFGMNEMAELGFVVVKIDGMGTNWRDKAFHDVSWKNLADSGFPDRIPWIKAAAATRAWMDLTRVGIYGGSAGGQNTLAGLLHHGDFYRAGVADCGCHDNRMDKIWWNEAWMGWPVDESYERNSNVVHADKLRGKLMLIVGELDNNVDPASTAQVVAALQKAGKIFDFVPVINAGHGAAETTYGKLRRAEFFVRHLAPEAEQPVSP